MIDISDIHDDVIKSKCFPRYWPFVRGIRRSTVDCPHKGKWCGVFMFSLICAWRNASAKIETVVIGDAIAPIVTSLQYVTATNYHNHDHRTVSCKELLCFIQVRASAPLHAGNENNTCFNGHFAGDFPVTMTNHNTYKLFDQTKYFQPNNLDICGVAVCTQNHTCVHLTFCCRNWNILAFHGNFHYIMVNNWELCLIYIYTSILKLPNYTAAYYISKQCIF